MKQHVVCLAFISSMLVSNVINATEIHISVDKAPIASLTRLLAKEFSKNISADSTFKSEIDTVSFNFTGSSIEEALALLSASNDYSWSKINDDSYVVSKVKSLVIKNQPITEQPQIDAALRGVLSKDGSYVLGPDGTLVIQERPSRIAMVRAAFQNTKKNDIASIDRTFSVSIVEERLEKTERLTKVLYSDQIQISEQVPGEIKKIVSTDKKIVDLKTKLRLLKSETKTSKFIATLNLKVKVETNTFEQISKESEILVIPTAPTKLFIGEVYDTQYYLVVGYSTFPAQGYGISQAGFTPSAQNLDIDPRRSIRTQDQAGVL